MRFDTPIFAGFDPAPNGGVAMVTAPRKGADPATSQLDDMVNAMLPPREWTEESGTWMQYTCKDPSTRLDVITLQELLDKRLVERQARESGICPVREDLYHQCFDELIRQVTLDGPERGLLLLRVRDEIRMTIDAYKILYESSITFGVKKQLQAEQGRSELEESVAELEKTKASLETTVAELRNKLEVVGKRCSERKALEDKKRKDELEFLKYQSQHLDSFLRQLGSSK